MLEQRVAVRRLVAVLGWEHVRVLVRLLRRRFPMLGRFRGRLRRSRSRFGLRRRRLPADGAERLLLQPRDLSGVGTAAALEVQMLADRVVQQTHERPMLSAPPTRRARAGDQPAPPAATAASARVVRFLPARLAA